MASVERPSFTQAIPPGATVRERDGERFACWTDRKGNRVEALVLPSGKCRRVVAARWVGIFRDHTGLKKKTPVFSTRGAALEAAIRGEQKGRAVREGRDLPEAAGGKLHLVRHVGDYLDHLEMDTNTGAKRRKEVKRMLEDILTRHKLTTPAAVDCDRLAKKLEQDRRAGPGEGERGHGSPYSYRTRNLWVVTLRAFGRWLRESRRLQLNPFDGLRTVNEEPHRTRARRSLSPDDFERLVVSTAASAEVVQGLSGLERAMLYTLAGHTGFRAGALTRLTPEAFTWRDGLPVAVYSAARLQKNKGAHGVEVLRGIAPTLARWLKTIPPGRRLFDGRVFLRTAELLAHDLAVARAGWVAEAESEKERERRELSDCLRYRNAAGEVFDFHSLRVQTATMLIAGGASLPEVQRVLDHSNPKLTSNIYTRFAGGMAGTMEKLPALPGLTAALGTALGAPGDDSGRKESSEVNGSP